MKRLAASVAIVVALCVCGLMFGGSGALAQKAPTTSDAWIAPTTADTASVLLTVPLKGRTLRIISIELFYSNAANTNPAYAGIVTADQAHTRQLWLGASMNSAAKGTLLWQNINRTIPAATAQGGVQLFISATASDTLSAVVEYEVDFDHPAF